MLMKASVFWWGRGASCGCCISTAAHYGGTSPHVTLNTILHSTHRLPSPSLHIKQGTLFQFETPLKVHWVAIDIKDVYVDRSISWLYLKERFVLVSVLMWGGCVWAEWWRHSAFCQAGVPATPGISPQVIITPGGADICSSSSSSCSCLILLSYFILVPVSWGVERNGK